MRDIFAVAIALEWRHRLDELNRGRANSRMGLPVGVQLCQAHESVWGSYRLDLYLTPLILKWQSKPTDMKLNPGRSIDVLSIRFTTRVNRVDSLRMVRLAISRGTLLGKVEYIDDSFSLNLSVCHDCLRFHRARILQQPPMYYVVHDWLTSGSVIGRILPRTKSVIWVTKLGKYIVRL